MNNNKPHRSDSEEASANKRGGKMNQVKGDLKETWGDVTNDPSTRREGRHDRVKGEMQEEYGKVKERESRIERDLDDLDDGRV
jgi:uncharacterized protein YjbJ (UPF0337 family)